MCAQVQKARGAHDLNSKGLGSIPLYQAAKDHTGLSTKGGGGELWETAWVDTLLQSSRPGQVSTKFTWEHSLVLLTVIDGHGNHELSWSTWTCIRGQGKNVCNKQANKASRQRSWPSSGSQSGARLHYYEYQKSRDSSWTVHQTRAS